MLVCIAVSESARGSRFSLEAPPASGEPLANVWLFSQSRIPVEGMSWTAGIDDGKDKFSVARSDGIGPWRDVAPWSTEETAAGEMADSIISARSAPAIDSSGLKMAKMRVLRSSVEDVWLMTPLKVPLLLFSAATSHKAEKDILNHSYGRHCNDRTE